MDERSPLDRHCAAADRGDPSVNATKGVADTTLAPPTRAAIAIEAAPRQTREDENTVDLLSWRGPGRVVLGPDPVERK